MSAKKKLPPWHPDPRRQETPRPKPMRAVEVAALIAARDREWAVAVSNCKNYRAGTECEGKAKCALARLLAEVK